MIEGKNITLHRKQNCNHYKQQPHSIPSASKHQTRMSDKSVIEYLSDHGIKASVQRIGVMRYLMEHLTHPSVEEIHGALQGKIPTLSKTTVYNTLRLLVEQGAARMITIDERTTKYDADCSRHAHFLCSACNCIVDIPIPEEHALQQPPKGYVLHDTQIYYHGLCPQCARKNQQQSENLNH